MTTVDITLPIDSWTLVANTTARTIITNSHEWAISYRFGTSSTSLGHTLDSRDTLIVDSDVYLKPIQSASTAEVKVAVTR